MRLKAKDIKVGDKVVVREFGHKYVYEITFFKEYTKLPGPGGAAFIALHTKEWEWGIPGLGGSFDLDEELEIEDVPNQA